MAATGSRAVPVIMSCVTAFFMPRQTGERPHVVLEVFISAFDVRALLDATVQVRDGQALGSGCDTKAGRFMRKHFLDKLEDNEIGELLHEAGLLTPRSSVASRAMGDNVYVRYLNGPLQWLGIIVGITVVAALVPTMTDSNWVAILFGVLVIAATLACIAMRVKLVVRDDVVTASVLGVFKKTMSLDDITGVSVGPETGLKEGAGPRVVDGSAAYIVSGPTVRIDYGASSLIASAKNPEEVVADIQSRLAA